MAGLPWFALYADFPAHPKTVRLCARLKDRNAGMHVVRLLAYAASYAQDGRIQADMVEHAAGAAAKRGENITEALLDAGFIAREGNDFIITGWEEKNGAHVRKRIRDAAKPRGNKPGPARDNGGTSAEPATERERERDTDTTTLSPRAEGERAAAVIALNAPPAHPNLDALVMALRAAGKTPSYPKHENRAAVDAAVASVGIETATARVVLAWNPATPHLGWYLADILQTAPKSHHRPPKAASVNAPAGIGTEWGKAPF